MVHWIHIGGWMCVPIYRNCCSIYKILMCIIYICMHIPKAYNRGYFVCCLFVIKCYLLSSVKSRWLHRYFQGYLIRKNTAKRGDVALVLFFYVWYRLGRRRLLILHSSSFDYNFFFDRYKHMRQKYGMWPRTYL